LQRKPTFSAAQLTDRFMVDPDTEEAIEFELNEIGRGAVTNEAHDQRLQSFRMCPAN
jgi:hypothetical protein